MDQYGLAVALDSDHPEFVRGVEAGRLWEQLDSPEAFAQTIHATNAEMAIRMCEAKGRAFTAADLDERWTELRVEARG